MPPTARLHLQKIDGITYRPLDWVHLLDVPNGRGAVLANTLAFESPSQNTLEGCIHAYTPHSAKFPGVIVATGTEVDTSLQSYLRAVTVYWKHRRLRGDIVA